LLLPRYVHTSMKYLVQHQRAGEMSLLPAAIGHIVGSWGSTDLALPD